MDENVKIFVRCFYNRIKEEGEIEKQEECMRMNEELNFIEKKKKKTDMLGKIIMIEGVIEKYSRKIKRHKRGKNF